MTPYLRHLRRQLWLRRLAQAVLLGTLAALAFGLSVAVEGGRPILAAAVGGGVVFVLVLLVGRPWAPLASCIDPKSDADALLRTVLSPHLSQAQRQVLLPLAERRSYRFLPVTDFPVWVGVLLCQLVIAGWIALTPQPHPTPQYGGLDSLHGVFADGSVRPEQTSAAEIQDQLRVPSFEDGERPSADRQWPHPVSADPSDAIRQGVDFGVEQAAYQRYLRNLAKQQ